MSAPMVRASLDDTKTQTRRVVKPQPAADECIRIFSKTKLANGDYVPSMWLPYPEGDSTPRHAAKVLRCPYGQPGDRLWVRETFFAFGRWETRFSAKKGRDEWHFIDMTIDAGKAYGYAADGGWPVADVPGRRAVSATPGWWRRPAIFMPRAASRITLEVTGVRVERLHDITHGDLEAEGLPCPGAPKPTLEQRAAHCVQWRSLWESINGAGSWDTNPWVWCVSFKQVQP